LETLHRVKVGNHRQRARWAISKYLHSATWLNLNCSLKVLDRDYFDLTKAINRGILAFLSALAEDERHRILNRANDGRVAGKAKGTRFGRKPKLTDISRQRHSSAWLPAKAADRWPRRWRYITPRWRG
jgi:hypothetical protein